MRKLFSVLFTLGLFLLNAQNNTPVKPLSFRYLENTPENIVFQEITQDKIDQLDKTINNDKNGRFPIVARTIATDFDLIKNSESRSIGNKIVYFFRIKANGAQGLIAYFDNFYLGYGSTLYIYSPDRTHITMLSHKDNNGTSFNTADLVLGDELIFEYAPGEHAEKDQLHVNEIGYGFNVYPQSPSRASDPMFGTSGSCEINVNCGEGEPWQDEKRAVVRILVKSGSVSGYCTGTLVNNTAKDCTPYVLTADHCQINENTGNNASVSDYNQWKFYFNFEAPDCENPSTVGTLNSEVITGSSRIAFSNDGGGETGSDFLLVQLKKRPDTMYNVYFAGWDATTVAPQSGVGIHHPSGDIKKISAFNNAATSSSMYGVTPNTHWRVRWSSTLNGRGVTEGGSSGSGIFDNNSHRVVGTLTGGGSRCASPNNPDFYGKLSYHWTANGSADSLRLKPWLDMAGTGETAMDGQYPIYIDDNYTCGIPQPTGIVTLSKIAISIFPNPSNGIFEIQCNEPILTVNIFDTNGRLLRRIDNNTNVQISDLSKGVYIAQIITKQGSSQQKIVIN